MGRYMPMVTMSHFISIIILVTFSFFAYSKAELTSITVLNSNFEVINTIDELGQLTYIQSLFHQSNKLELSTKPNWKYKLDLKGGKKSGRWLYDPEGFICVLNYQLNSCYKIENPVKVRSVLIGI
jgi:hypothetical protein